MAEGRHMYCIVFDAFRTINNDDYVPKKCSIYDVTTGTNICTYFISPPYPWEELHTTAKSVNSFLSRYLIGTNWYDGHVTYDHFMMCLLKYSENAPHIFTKGIQCQQYLSKILGRPVVDIEPLLTEIPAEIVTRFKKELPLISCAYMDHTRKFFKQGFQDPQYTCCQSRAYLYGNIVRYYIVNTERVELKRQIQNNINRTSSSATGQYDILKPQATNT
jgi:hypothetical protein